MEFPLYIDLVLNQPEIKIQTDEICSVINKLPHEHVEIIYALILHYYISDSMENGKMSMENITKTLNFNSKPKRGRTSDLPYEGKTSFGGKGALFKLEKIPSTLSHIITCYINSIVDF